MKILSLELFGYNRFNLSNITKFKITPKSSIQIIIGTNGCGKSSLLEALSPYPQPKSDFITGGEKSLELEHNNSHYLLVSRYSNSAKHEFIKNGINLNEGGTFSVQKELVEKELGFSSHLHDLLTGKLTFTNMNSVQRRNWIMRISGIDLEYALGLYDKIKTKLRDAQGALKHSEVRLGTESQKLLDEVSLAQMLEKNNILQKNISFLISKKKSSLPNLIDLENEFKLISDKIEALSSQMLRSKFTFNEMKKFKTMESVLNEENLALAEDKSLKAVLKEQENRLDEYIQTLKQLKDDGAMDISGLEKKLDTLYEIKSKIAKVPEYFGELSGDSNSILKDTVAVRFSLSELVADLKGSDIDVPDKEHWDKYVTDLDAIELKIQICENKLINLNKKKQNLESVNENKCPKCKYVYKPGISEKELENLKKQIESTSNDQSKLLTEKKKLKFICESINIRKDEINRFRALAHSYPRLRNFWNKIAKMRYLHNDPKIIMYEYKNWHDCVSQFDRLELLNKEIYEVEIILNRIKKIGEKVDVEYFVKNKSMISDKIQKSLSAIDKNNEKLSKIKKYKSEFQTIANNLSQLVSLIKRFKDLADMIIDGNIQKEISNRLDLAQINLSNNKRKQTEAETINAIILDLKKSISQLKADIKSLVGLEKALSPTDGLIAESMLDFIKTFTDQLNNLINKVWEYDMKIMPCSKSETELDFKFPLKVMSKNTTISDIIKGSSGQKEIINFVFTLAVMVYLNLKDFPLFLDEIGTKFDPAHKSNLIMFVKWLIENELCTQIWMVSHYATDHGGLANSEVCCIDSSNVTLPDTYNEHVLIG